MKIEFTVTLDQWREIAEFARAQGMTIQDFVRAIVIREIETDASHD